MQAHSSSALNAYLASQANPGMPAGMGPWASVQDTQAGLQQSTNRQGDSQQSAHFGSAEALAFSSNAAANLGQDFRNLVRPHPQYHQIVDTRAAAKPPAYAASEHAAFAPNAWQSDTRASTAMPDPWTLAQPRQPPYGYGSDSNMSTWQQQLANLQQVPVPGQHPQLQHQGWGIGNDGLGQQQQQRQHIPHHLEPVQKPSSGDQLVQDLRAHWGSMASPSHQPQPGLTPSVPQPLPTLPSQSGFEHMWGPASAPGLGNQGSVGLASQQPAVPAAARLPDDFSVLDFPDWDGPGAGAASLDDMIMNSIGVAGGQAGADPLLPQSGQDVAQHTVADQLHAVKAAKKGKQKGGKKAAGRNAKGPRAAPSSMAPPANTEDGITVEFFVAAPEDKHDDALEAQGNKVAPVVISKLEPESAQSAMSNVAPALPQGAPGMHVLHWAFGGHFPEAWKAH